LNKNWNGLKPFFPALLNLSRRADYLFTEQSSYGFEALEMNSVPQNNLPLQGFKPPKSGFSKIKIE
jgi:hypothetical protein